MVKASPKSLFDCPVFSACDFYTRVLVAVGPTNVTLLAVRGGSGRGPTAEHGVRGWGRCFFEEAWWEMTGRG